MSFWCRDGMEQLTTLSVISGINSMQIRHPCTQYPITHCIAKLIITFCTHIKKFPLVFLSTWHHINFTNDTGWWYFTGTLESCSIEQRVTFWQNKQCSLKLNAGSSTLDLKHLGFVMVSWNLIRGLTMEKCNKIIASSQCKVRWLCHRTIREYSVVKWCG